MLTIGAVSIITGAVSLQVLKSPSTSTEVTLIDSPVPSVQTSPDTPQPIEPPPSLEPLELPERKPAVAVSIVGEVQSPGVYHLTEDPRIDDLIHAAGGLTDGANVSDINRAAKLIDGTTLTIPSLPDPGVDIRHRSRGRPRNPAQYTVSGWAVGSSPNVVPNNVTVTAAATQHAGTINVNAATQQELESLPGIGPVYAAAIIQYRSRQLFQSIDELENVSGIGPKRLEAIRNLVRVH